MQSDVAQLIATIVVGSSVVLFLCAFLVAFLFFYQKKKFIYLKEKAALTLKYEQELLRAQIEIQNQTLQHIGGELHDNIGQLLSVAKLQLNVLTGGTLPEKEHQQVQETSKLISHTLKELRALSKSLDSDLVEDFGLMESLDHELQRIDRTGHLNTHLTITGQPYRIDPRKEMILFRVSQEVINNAIKHAQAKNLTIHTDFQQRSLELRISDDGLGFDPEAARQKPLDQSGSGLRNMRRRIELIGGTFDLKSQPAQGTTITLRLTRENV